MCQFWMYYWTSAWRKWSMLRALSLRISWKMLLILSITFTQLLTLLLSLICWYFLQGSESKGVIFSFPSLLKDFHLFTQAFPCISLVVTGLLMHSKSHMPSREQLKAIKQNEKCFSDSSYALTVALQTKFHTVFILDLAHHYFQLLRAKLPSVQSLYNSLLFTALPSKRLKMLSQMIRTINLPLPLQDQELQCLKLIRETWQSNSVLIRKPIPMFWSRTELLFACKRNTNVWCKWAMLCF